jgi:hypothetical protein
MSPCSAALLFFAHAAANIAINFSRCAMYHSRRFCTLRAEDRRRAGFPWQYSGRSL